MKADKSNFSYLIAFIITGAILGSAVGNLLGNAVPALAFFKQSLTTPVGFNIEVISFHLTLNPVSLIGIASGIFLFFKL